MGNRVQPTRLQLCVLLVASTCVACGGDGQSGLPLRDGDPGGGTPAVPAAASGGAYAAGSGGAGTGGTGTAAGGATAGRAAGSGSAGVASASGASGGAGMAGQPIAGTLAAAGSGGMPAAGSGGAAAGAWPAADPAKLGPFMTVMESGVGPGMAFTMFRPTSLERRHPVITWGNGTGAMPTSYRGLLTLYASHGFIVIASNSTNVAQGTPAPMLQGVTWVLEQDMTEGSMLFGKVDRDHIGATGHSQGAFATTTAGADVNIKTIAPIQALSGSRGLHGPVLALCGTMDTLVPCSRNLSSWSSLTGQPAMYAELKTADHTMWIRGGAMHPYFSATTAWFRVHLMGDQALRPMFYGACSLCQDTANWVTMRKLMD